MRTLEPSKSVSMRDHISKLQDLHQEVLEAGKQISSEDMAITLLSQLPKPKYAGFYSSLTTSITWVELVPMVSWIRKSS